MLILREGNPSHVATGVALDVGERLLSNAEKAHFQFGGKTAECIGQVEVYADTAALRETRGVPAQRGGQSELIEQRRVQEIGYGTDLLNTFFKGFRALGKKS